MAVIGLRRPMPIDLVIGDDEFTLETNSYDDSVRVFKNGSGDELMVINGDFEVTAGGKYIGRIRNCLTHYEFRTPFGLIPIENTGYLAAYEKEVVRWYFTKLNEPSSGLFHEFFKSPPDGVV